MLWECFDCGCEFLEFEAADDDNSMRGRRRLRRNIFGKRWRR